VLSEAATTRTGPPRWRQRLASPNSALALSAVVVVLAGLYVPMALGAPEAVSGIPGNSLIEALVFAAIGLLVARRQPRHRVGWILLGVALLLALSSDGSLYAVLDYNHHHGQLPLGPLAELFNLLWIPGILLIPIGVLYFPDGQLPAPRWKYGVRAYVALGGGLVAAMYGVAIHDLAAPVVSVAASTGDIADFDNPTGALSLMYAAWAATVSLGSLAGLVGLALNYRRSRGERRQQLKWFVLGAGVFLLLGLPTVVVPNVNIGNAQLQSTVFDVAFMAPAAAVAIAVLKYRLYDVDVVISRAIVYGSLAVFITAVYVGIAVGLGALVGSGGKPNLALSILATALVAIGFQPVRERVQRVANRLVYGKRATPYEVLSQFSERVAESYAVDEVMPRMARVLAEGTGAQRSDVWLRGGTTWRDAAVWPSDATRTDSVTVLDDGLPPLNGASRLVEVRHQGDLLGALSITKRAGETLTPVEENLLSHLAGQAGLVLKNVGLTADLQARLEELRASRQRLVSAQDEERRRLERNLHDGAQQHLVAIKVKLGLAEMMMERDPLKATATLDQLKSDADEALETLRDLARGIYPPLLADKGLQAALESQARKATVPVTVDADGLGRYSQDIEAAVYFSVLEALQNVQKYAQASGAAVHLCERDRELQFSVIDDGNGFDAATTKKGSGLVNMADRIDSLGGAVAVDSTPGNGTELRGSLPLYEATLAADHASASRSGLNSDLEMKPAAPASSA
jgi:signal transduction histidine kinase